MKALVLALIATSTLCAEVDTLIHNPEPQVAASQVSGEWEIDGRQITVSLNAANNLSKISVDDEIDLWLSEYKFVKRVLIPKSESAIVFELGTWRNQSIGIYEARILYIAPRDIELGWNGPLKIVECLGPEYLTDLDGYPRSVLEVGCVDRFPIVEVKLLYSISRSRVSENRSEWIDWDLKKRLPLEALSPSGWMPQNTADIKTN